MNPSRFPSSTALRICLVLEWAFVLLGVVLYFLLESSLPQPLQDWLLAESEEDSTPLELVPALLMFPLLLATLVGSIGLFFLKRWAAWLYLISIILGYFLLPFTGPTVAHALADTVDGIGILFSGMVLGIAFFSDALRPKPCVQPPALP